MQISDSGKEFIKSHEGLSLKAYPDAGGYSVGYGHLIKSGEQGLMDGITLGKANELFDDDIAGFETYVDGVVTANVSQNEFDALVSFCYNVGKGNFGSSTLLRKVNAGDRKGAACEFMRWIYTTRGGVKYVVPGLRKRRKDEQILYYGSEPDCAGIVEPEKAAEVVEDNQPARKDAPVRGGGYAKNTLPQIILDELDKISDTLKATGKLAEKKGYKVQRQGDYNAGQGRIAVPNQSSVYVNGKPVSVDGSLVVGPAPKHPSTTANGSRQVFAEGKRVNFETNADANQLPRIGGSDDTFTR